MNLKKYLKNKLTEKQAQLVPKSFDMIGSIAIFSNFPAGLKKKKKFIAETLMKLNKNIKTVAEKTKKVSGKYRTRKINIIAGERKKETLHKENNALIKLNVETCYFTPRLSNERLRIASLAKKNEKVLVMFSGVGVYPLIISKNSEVKKIVGIEINPKAHKYAIENVKLNKRDNIELFLGDVKKIIPKLKIKFDRIIMPLPLTSLHYLNDAFKVAKKGAFMHLYVFDLDASLERLKKEKIKLIKIVRAGQISPGKYRYCIDFKL